MMDFLRRRDGSAATEHALSVGFLVLAAAGGVFVFAPRQAAHDVVDPCPGHHAAGPESCVYVPGEKAVFTAPRDADSVFVLTVGGGGGGVGGLPQGLRTAWDLGRGQDGDVVRTSLAVREGLRFTVEPGRGGEPGCAFGSLPSNIPQNLPPAPGPQPKASPAEAEDGAAPPPQASAPPAPPPIPSVDASASSGPAPAVRMDPSMGQGVQQAPSSSSSSSSSPSYSPNSPAARLDEAAREYRAGYRDCKGGDGMPSRVRSEDGSVSIVAPPGLGGVAKREQVEAAIQSATGDLSKAQAVRTRVLELEAELSSLTRQPPPPPPPEVVLPVESPAPVLPAISKDLPQDAGRGGLKGARGGPGGVLIRWDPIKR